MGPLAPGSVVSTLWPCSLFGSAHAGSGIVDLVCRGQAVIVVSVCSWQALVLAGGAAGWVPVEALEALA